MDFPLEVGEYFGVPDEGNEDVISRGVWIVQIRRAIGAKPGSVYDDRLADQVRGWQEIQGLPPTGEIADEDWVVLFPQP
jgi:hypothetical protein